MTDITFKLADTVINLRVGAIIRFRDQILLCRLPDHDWWFLPGGRITCGESSLEAIIRELSEEIHGNFEVLHPALTSENFFVLDGRRFHEFCIYYAVRWRDDPDALVTKGSEIFSWVRLTDLGEYVIKPDFIRDALSRDLSKLSHIIHKDSKGGGPPVVFCAHEL